MEESFQTFIFNARKLDKAFAYEKCIEYINTHFQILGEYRLTLGKPYCLQVQAYYQLENYDDGIIAALHALEINPDKEDYYLNLAAVYKARNKINEGIVYY